MSGRSLYRESVVFTAHTEGKYGRVDGTATTVLANAQPGFRQVVNANGREVTASLSVMIEAEHDGLVHIGDKAVWDGNTYAVIAVNPVRIRGQTDHIEIDCGPQGVSG